MAGDTSSLTQDDYCLSTTSSLEFIQAIHAFLGRNRIESIGPVRICLESTIRGVPRICVTGEVGRSIFPVVGIAHSSPRSDLDLIDGRLDWSNVTPSPRPITAIKHVPPPALTATETLHSPQEHGFALSPYSELVPSWVQTTPEIGTYDSHINTQVLSFGIVLKRSAPRNRLRPVLAGRPSRRPASWLSSIPLCANHFS